MTDLRAVTNDQRRCPALYDDGWWGTVRQCELVAGHDDLHRAHRSSRLDVITWTSIGGRR